jgi:hypothetical protein
MSGDLFQKFLDDEIAVVMLLESEKILKLRLCISLTRVRDSVMVMASKVNMEAMTCVAPAFLLVVVEGGNPPEGPFCCSGAICEAAAALLQLLLEKGAEEKRDRL